MAGNPGESNEKRIAQSASWKEDRFRLLVEAVTDYAIYLLDPSGIVSSWNPGAERFKGYKQHEIIGQNFSRFYTPEDQASGLPKKALSIADKEGRFESEGWRVRKDGTRFWAHVIIDPVRDPEGGLLGFAKITRDLTERKQAQEDLRRSEERFRLLVQGVTDYAIYMLDPTGRVANWNAGAAHIKGYTANEIIGRHFSQFYTPEDREAGEPERALETAAREGRFEKEAWRVRKDGSRFWASIVIDAIRDDAGRLIGFAKITRDITERRNAQIELERAREAFFQSQKMEALGQLTGGIAHDFNNLLTAVLGSLEMLRKRLPNDPRLVQLLDNAVQGAERGAQLTQRMLAFARRQELTPEPLDLALLVRGLDSLLQRTLGPSVAVETRLEDVRPALADANQIELAVLNLAVNARDAMPVGGKITIDVSKQTLERERDGLARGDYVRLAVIDAGEGMDEETLKRATEPFFTTKGVGRGTGLGLSTVHGLMDQLGGRLKLKSRKGEGTTAELWLPIVEGEAVNAHPRPRRTVDTAPAPSPARPLTVLAVDDDGLVLMNTSAMLEEFGHKVLEASSGAQALALIRGDPGIDLVVTDYAMPVMTGSDLVAAIRAERPKLPVILATGYAELPSGAEVDALRLPKPFGQLELGRAIAAAMRLREPVGA